MLVHIDTLDTTPIYEQLRNQIVIGISTKCLALGEKLPSVRRLAADLSINLHTVNKAYTMLSDEGYIVVDRQKGALVATSMSVKEPFKSKLEQKLELAAAEAICHGLDKEAFIALCIKNFQIASGTDISEGKSQKSN